MDKGNICVHYVYVYFKNHSLPKVSYFGNSLISSGTVTWFLKQCRELTTCFVLHIVNLPSYWDLDPNINTFPLRTVHMKYFQTLSPVKNRPLMKSSRFYCCSFFSPWSLKFLSKSVYVKVLCFTVPWMWFLCSLQYCCYSLKM